jgi:hypothetical protein
MLNITKLGLKSLAGHVNAFTKQQTLIISFSTYCDQTNIECVIPDNDERKRPTSKAYTSTLTNRIEILEKMLIERGAEPPPVVYPAKTKNRRSASMIEQPETPDTRKRTKSMHSDGHVPFQHTISQEPHRYVIMERVTFRH